MYTLICFLMFVIFIKLLTLCFIRYEVISVCENHASEGLITWRNCGNALRKRQYNSLKKKSLINNGDIESKQLNNQKGLYNDSNTDVEMFQRTKHMKGIGGIVKAKDLREKRGKSVLYLENDFERKSKSIFNSTMN